jgi:hypothetical protein
MGACICKALAGTAAGRAIGLKNRRVERRCSVDGCKG